MSAGTGVTYELEFKFTDKGTLNFLKKLNQEAEKIAKSLDKISLKNLSKQAENLKKVMSNNNDVMKQQVKIAKQVTDTMVNGSKKYRESTEQSIKSVKKMNDLLEKGSKTDKRKVENKNVFNKLKGNMTEKALNFAKDFIINAGQEALQGFGNADYELRGAAAKTGGYGAHLKEYSKLAKKVGGDTKFNNLDVAQAINAGATLGITQAEMEKMIPAAANLAQAFNTDITPALEMIKMHMNSYQLTGKEAFKVTDMIAITSKNTAADLSRLSEGFKYVGASGQALQIPLETVYAMLGKLNDNGLVGSTAGTGLNQMFESLKDFKKRSKLEQVIGKVTDKKGDLIDVVTIMERLQTQTSKMGNADKTGILKSIFGVQGGRAVNALLNGSVDSLKNLQKEIKNSAGASGKLSSFMMQGSAGAIETLMGTISSTFFAVFEAMEPLIVPVAGAFMKLAEGIGFVAEKMPWLLQFGTVIASYAIGATIFEKFKKEIKEWSEALKVGFKTLAGGNAILVMTFAVALIYLFNLFKKWQDYVQANENVGKEWEKTLQILGYALSNLGDLIMAFVGALFGLNTTQEDTTDKTKFWGATSEQVAKNLREFNKQVFELTIKLQDAKRWVEENSDKIKMFAGALVTIKVGVWNLKALAVAQQAFNTAISLNPYVLIAIGIVAAIYGIWAGLKWLYDNTLWFSKAVDTVWGAITDTIDHAVSQAKGIINGLIEMVKEAYGAFQSLLSLDFKGFWEHAKGGFTKFGLEVTKKENEYNQKHNFKQIKLEEVGKIKFPVNNISNLGIPQMAQSIKKHAVGTDNFQSSGRGGMTTVDEHGDEAIWLPNGSMVARNTTTRDILSQMKGINRNTKGGSSASSTTINNNHFEINIASGGRDGAFEFVSELKRLGFE